MVTYRLHQRPVSGHNWCYGIEVEIEPLSPSTGRVVFMKCCACCLGEMLGTGTVVKLPHGNWKQAEILSYGEDCTVVKPRDLSLGEEGD